MTGSMFRQWFGVGAALVLGAMLGCHASNPPATPRAAGAPPAALSGADGSIRTTDASIAMQNMGVQIAVLNRQATQGTLTVAQRAALAELLSARGQYTGSIADRERALAMGEALAREFPADPIALVARARGRAAFHQFSDALTDLDAAAVAGAPAATVENMRAGVLQALGHYDEALVVRREKAERYPNADTLGALASLEAERGEVDSAERLFAAARHEYRDVSPFPLAWLLFDEGAMRMRHGDLEGARALFAAAHRRLPDFAAAQCHLAEVEAALGRPDRAVALLEPLATTSDDPDAAAQLARILMTTGRRAAAARWRAVAAARYEELLARYPDAYADHGAEFYLTAGEDPARALAWAQHNLAVRRTPRAYELLLASALAAGQAEVACSLQDRATAAQDHSPALTDLLARTTLECRPGNAAELRQPADRGWPPIIHARTGA